jgi:hypothetical protein
MKDDQYELRCKIAKEAFESGCLIFVTGDRWYTPREFVDSKVVVDIKKLDTREYYENVTKHTVKHAISHQLTKVRETEKQFEVFMNKVLTAFELHPIKKNK